MISGPMFPGVPRALLLLLAAVALRLALFSIVGWLHPAAWDAASPASDAHAYIGQASVFAGETQTVGYALERRVFPGLPLAIALVHRTGIPLRASGLLVSWFSAGLAAVFAASLYRDMRVGWAMVFLTPAYLVTSDGIMNESLLSALSLAAVLVGLRGHAAAAGILFGGAGAVRPNACFALFGFLVYEAMHRRWRSALTTAAVSAVVVLSAMALVWHFFGDPLINMKAYRDLPSGYRGHILTWPLLSLIQTSLRVSTSAWKIAYTWAHVVLVLAACILCARSFRHTHEPLDALSLVWLVGNTAFVLSMGGVWGFHDFPRAITWAIAPLLGAYAPFLPKRTLGWIGLAATSSALALAYSLHQAVQPPPTS
jgi:hypothetical protein